MQRTYQGFKKVKVKERCFRRYAPARDFAFGKKKNMLRTFLELALKKKEHPKTSFSFDVLIKKHVQIISMLDQ